MNELIINGRTVEAEVDPRTPFLEVLREVVGLKGTKYGCGEGECGACTILVDGRSTCSCLTLTGSLSGAQITTVEGMANDPVGTRLFHAFAEKGAVQCGFCTPGFILSSWEHLSSAGGATDPDAIRTALSGNLCRCTGYVKIVEAVAQCGRDLDPPSAVGKRTARATPMRIEGKYWRPTELEELLSGLTGFAPGARLIAGGTDLMVQLEHELHAVPLIDLSAIAELRGITITDHHLRIGATTSWSEIRTSDAVRDHAPVLALAAAEIGGVQIQNRGTIGGNIVNASPAGDGIAALHAHDAQVELRSRTGRRTLPIGEFILGPRRTALGTDEIVTAVLLPRRESDAPTLSFFEKLGPRKAQAISKAVVAFHARRNGAGLVAPRIALGAVGPVIIRAEAAEKVLAGGTGARDLRRAATLVAEAARPIDDLRSSAEYRRKAVAGLLLRGLRRAGLETED